MHGPTRIFWADLIPFSLQWREPAALAPPQKAREAEVWQDAAGGEEFRIDAADGCAYTRVEFLAEYGGRREWDAAPLLGAADSGGADHAAEPPADAYAILREGGDEAVQALVAAEDWRAKVRKTPSWSRCWANFTLCVVVFPQECMGQLASFGPA